MESERHEKLLPSQVTAIIHRVLTDRLKEKEYSADEAKMWCIDLANDIKSAVKDESRKTRLAHSLRIDVGDAPPKLMFMLWFVPQKRLEVLSCP